MYYPYLRGRQYELIALRELVENRLIGEKVVPIIEPIKPTSTLSSTLRTFNMTKKKCAVVMNPEVSDFASQITSSTNNNRIIPEIVDFINMDNVIKAFILNDEAETFLRNRTDEFRSQVMTISTSPDGLDIHENLFENVSPAMSLIPEGALRFKRSIKESKVLFEDRFNKAQKNADYSKQKDEFFSDDHNFYIDEGYSGFADYSVIGAEYSETGFAPLAVAIHIVYFGKKNELRVKHFVSDTNNDINDPAGKFGEAVGKLYEWSNESNIYRTRGLSELISCHLQGRYPGLGTVKKYSIMHHLELVNRYLEGEL